MGGRRVRGGVVAPFHPFHCYYYYTLAVLIFPAQLQCYTGKIKKNVCQQADRRGRGEGGRGRSERGLRERYYVVHFLSP